MGPRKKSRPARSYSWISRELLSIDKRVFELATKSILLRECLKYCAAIIIIRCTARVFDFLIAYSFIYLVPKIYDRLALSYIFHTFGIISVGSSWRVQEKINFLVTKEFFFQNSESYLQEDFLSTSRGQKLRELIGRGEASNSSTRLMKMRRLCFHADVLLTLMKSFLSALTARTRWGKTLAPGLKMKRD